jgi:hypothetical protein
VVAGASIFDARSRLTHSTGSRETLSAQLAGLRVNTLADE